MVGLITRPYEVDLHVILEANDKAGRILFLYISIQFGQEPLAIDSISNPQP